MGAVVTLLLTSSSEPTTVLYTRIGVSTGITAPFSASESFSSGITGRFTDNRFFYTGVAKFFDTNKAFGTAITGEKTNISPYSFKSIILNTQVKTSKPILSEILRYFRAEYGLSTGVREYFYLRPSVGTAITGEKINLKEEINTSIGVVNLNVLCRENVRTKINGLFKIIRVASTAINSPIVIRVNTQTSIRSLSSFKFLFSTSIKDKLDYRVNVTTAIFGSRLSVSKNIMTSVSPTILVRKPISTAIYDQSSNLIEMRAV